MKLRGPPLWLVCDVFCWLGVLVSFISFVTAFAGAVMRMTAQKRRRFEPHELASLARLQAEQEAWLGYAITRRVFRLAGIRARARFKTVSPARTLWALKHRASQTLRDSVNLDGITQRRAQRLKRLMATPPPSLPRAGEAPRAPAVQPLRSVGGPSSLWAATPRLRAGLRVRAPPWRALTSPRQTTRALL